MDRQGVVELTALGIMLGDDALAVSLLVMNNQAGTVQGTAEGGLVQSLSSAKACSSVRCSGSADWNVGQGRVVWMKTLKLTA